MGGRGGTHLQNHNRDAAVVLAQVGVFFQVRVLLEQLPSGLVGDAPVFPGNELPDLAVLQATAECESDLDAQHSPDAGRAVAVNDLDRGITLLAGDGQLAVKPLDGLRRRRHALFQVHQLQLHPRNLLRRRKKKKRWISRSTALVGMGWLSLPSCGSRPPGSWRLQPWPGSPWPRQARRPCPSGGRAASASGHTFREWLRHPAPPWLHSG